MAKKADAWKEYKEAAILDMMLDAMPKVRMTYEIHNYFSVIHFIYTKIRPLQGYVDT